jgi:hypothetical protein
MHPSKSRVNVAASRLETPEDRVDRLGIWFSLLMLCVGLVTMAVWLVSEPSFEKCSALESQTQRSACYDKLRDDWVKFPAKGANAPALEK